MLASVTSQNQPTWRLACVWAAVIAALAIPVANGIVPSVAPVVLHDDDTHRIVSLRMALNWRVCGSYSHTTVGNQLDRILFSAGGMDVPILSLPERAGIDLETYCSTFVRPARINENSLMLTMAAIMWARPGSTLRQLGWLMHGIRVLALAGVVAVVLRAGASWLYALVWMVSALVILASVETTHYFSVYPFLMPMLAGSAALVAWLADVSTERRLRWGLMASVGVGLITGYIVNLRTSYAPIVVAMLPVLFISGPLIRGGHWRRGLALAVGVGGGVLLFQRAFITPIDEIPNAGNLSYHHVFHPLVLGLALPPNELATREGIRWDDAVGIEIARREEPSVRAFSAEYEGAMRSYYLRLWRSTPGDMARLYWTKWKTTMGDVLSYRESVFPVRLISWAAWPMRPFSNGITFSLLLVGVIAVAGRARHRWNRAAMALSLELGIVGLLLIAEAAIIVPHFSTMYGAPRMLLMVTMGLCVWQYVLNRVLGGVMGLRI